MTHPDIESPLSLPPSLSPAAPPLSYIWLFMLWAWFLGWSRAYRVSVTAGIKPLRTHMKTAMCRSVGSGEAETGGSVGVAGQPALPSNQWTPDLVALSKVDSGRRDGSVLRTLLHLHRTLFEFQIPIWHLTAICDLGARGADTLWSPLALGILVLHIHMCRQDTHTHKLK